MSAKRSSDPSSRASRRRLVVRGVAAAVLLFAAGVTPLSVSSSQAQSAAEAKDVHGASTGDTLHGQRIFADQGCGRCHGSQGEGLAATGSDAPMPPLRATTLSLPSFVQLVRVPRSRMPPYTPQQVSDSDLADVYVFLHSAAATATPQPSTVANAGDGQRLFARYGCAECHLSRGQGSRVTGARVGPPAIPLSAFITYVRRPTGEMPPYTQKVVSDTELADMYAFLQTAPQPPSWKSIPLLNP